ncbi:MAG: hypothetical protein GC160_26830 [Acidobacteria bacterium]|nr:hypothetical protein [Acidobacteriota bacterium]
MSWIETPTWTPAAAPEPARDAGHVGLIGHSISADWTLITALKRRHPVTLAESVAMLHPAPYAIDVLALECTGLPRVAETVRLLRRRQPSLRIVLVGGGLSQSDVAEAFREGALDFFPNPEESALLAERLHSLCRLHERERNSPDEGRSRGRAIVRHGETDFVA